MPRPESIGCPPVYSAVVVGCSAGGVTAAGQLLAQLSPQLKVPVIIVCHNGSEDIELLCEVLALVSRLPVREASERHRPEAGIAYLAPAGYHLLIERDGHFALSVDERVAYSRPSIDVLFLAAAECYRDVLIGVVLTGANEDGAEGLLAIRSHGGLGIVQSPETAEVGTMPAAALRIAGADHTAPLDGIATLINHYCS